MIAANDAAPVFRDVGWLTLAACRDVDPDLFFPSGTSRASRVQVVEAKQVCTSCPVRDLCREWALATTEGHGVWGGLDEFERRAVGRQRRWKRRWLDCRWSLRGSHV